MSKTKKSIWKGIISNLVWIIKQGYQTSPVLLYFRSVMVMVQGALTCVICFAIGWEVNRVIEAYGHEGEAQKAIIEAAVVLGGLAILNLLAEHLSSYLSLIAGDKLRLHLSLQVMEKSAAIDLEYIENAGNEDMLNKRHGLEYTTCGTMDSLYSLIRFATLLIGLITLCLYIGWPAFALASFLIALQVGRAVSVFSTRKDKEDIVEKHQRMYYFQSLMTEKGPSKEIRLFGLDKYLVPGFVKNFREVMGCHQCWSVSGFLGIVCDLLALGSIIVFLYWTALQVMGKELPISTFVTVLAAMVLAEQVSRRFYGLFFSIRRSQDGLNLYRSFLAIEPKIFPALSLATVPESFGEGVRFENVSLTYPGGDTPALKDINLLIKPGSRIALVGENGSGKTSFVKLLTRLYDPTEGTIKVADKELKSYNVDTYRSRFGVIFQNFMRYHGTVYDNVGFAQHERIDDHEAIQEAIEKSGAKRVVDRMADGFETKIGGWFEKGTDLSDGQWQKIALARAFFREADFLVLDEPTSVLDARAEYEIFQKFLELTHGKTTVLISHRFSTVRMADLICVFDAGRIVEQGSHSDLMAQDGLYSELFRMQAEGYQLD